MDRKILYAFINTSLRRMSKVQCIPPCQILQLVPLCLLVPSQDWPLERALVEV